MILLDADVLLIDLRYTSDVRFPTNRQALDRLRTGNFARGSCSQALLEVVGILSFNLSPKHVRQLPRQLQIQYGLSVFPDLDSSPHYAGCTVGELVAQMTRKMALGDAVQAVQIARYIPTAACLLTWNAKHFQGKVSIPVLTPADWLSSHTSTAP